MRLQGVEEAVVVDHLLVATRSGKLQVLNLDVDGCEVLFEADLSVSEPKPTPAPAWAQHW